jgi:hypothetical protein
MQLDLDDDETLALLNLLVEVIEADRYTVSPRIRIATDPGEVRTHGPSAATAGEAADTGEAGPAAPAASTASAAVTVFPFHWKVRKFTS